MKQIKNIYLGEILLEYMIPKRNEGFLSQRKNFPTLCIYDTILCFMALVLPIGSGLMPAVFKNQICTGKAWL